jgi:hypothetical protein
MRIRLSKSRVWSGLVVCAAVLGLTSIGPVHAADKVDICHALEDLLVAHCQPVTARCPCWDARLIERTFAALQVPTADIVCSLAPGPGLLIEGPPLDPRFLATLSGPGPAFCFVQCNTCTPPLNIQVFEGNVVTEADILACESEIRQAADRLGVPCP